MSPECDKEWSRRHIVNTCGQTFANKAYKKHREQILYDKERALLPATQQIVERIQMVEQLKMEVKEIDAERLRLSYKKDDLIQTILRLEDSKNEPVERVLFTTACPSSTCRGFLNTHLKCGLCQIKVCSECREIKGEDHACNPDSVATAKLLAADTKPCPQCRTSIHKIDGCDQMWCTLCHTAFSWRTGKRETIIHNPHYYEYMRKQSPTGEIPRNEGQCAELSQNTFRRIRQKVVQYIGYDSHITDKTTNDQLDCISNSIQAIIHITHNEMTGRYKEIDYVGANQDLRVSFMRGHITEETFKTLLQRSEKGNQKRQEIRAIFLMVQTSASDVIRRFESNINSRDELVEMLPITIQEISAIAEYANEQFAEITKTYKMPPISLASNLKINEKKRA